MALKNNTTGEYLKITSFQFDFSVGNHHISYLIFANQEQRQRYDLGLSEYETYKSAMYNGIGIIENALNIELTNGTTKNAIFAACYSALKTDVFPNWIDA
jgi:hypothetical protein